MNGNGKALDSNSLPVKEYDGIIIGGGGSGAIVLPNMICLSSEDLNSRGLVKIGTGRYIDCP